MDLRRPLFGLLLLLYRILGVVPFVPAAFKYFNFLVTCACELMRHTGAGSLVGSGAIEYDRLVLRNFGHPLPDFVRRSADRALYFRLGGIPV